MIHPSYVELMDVVNHEVEKTGDQPVVNSRYSIVTATAKRAREIIDGDEPLIYNDINDKPLSIAVNELFSGSLKILTDEEIKEGEEKKEEYEILMEKKRREAREAEKEEDQENEVKKEQDKEDAAAEEDTEEAAPEEVAAPEEAEAAAETEEGTEE